MKKKTINMEGVSPESWARTIFLMIALINQVLAVLGKGQIEIAEDGRLKQPFGPGFFDEADSLAMNLLMIIFKLQVGQYQVH